MPATIPIHLLDALSGGLVVSCQARPGNPLYGADSMTLMAQAAELGGAKGLRVNGPIDVSAVLAGSSLPVMAVNKVEHPGCAVMITPTVASARSLLDIGARIVALDATDRPRPGRETLRDIVSAIHAGGALAMGDLASIDDLGSALFARIDAVGTTLSGHTAFGSPPDEPDFAFLAALVKQSPVPVFAEGRYWTPEQVIRAFEIGARFVVVGTAITNPMAITSRFVQAIEHRQTQGEG